jgi:hypothetical protein
MLPLKLSHFRRSAPARVSAPVRIRRAVFLLVAGAACSPAHLPEAARSAAGAAARPGTPEPREAFPFVAEATPVRALAGSGRWLWAGNARGLRRWDLAAGDVASFDIDDGLPGTVVSSIALEGDKAIWVVTDGGVARGDRRLGATRFETVVKDPSFSQVFVGNQTAFLGGQRGLFRFDPKSRQLDVIWSAGTITAIGRGSAGGVCAAAAGGAVACFDETGRQVLDGSATEGGRVPATFVGLGHEPGGTAVMAGASLEGRARLLFLGAAGSAAYEGEGMPALTAIAEGSRGPVLVAPRPEDGASQMYLLRRAERGETAREGAYRFVPVQRRLEAPRYVAEPIGRASPFAITAAVTVEDNVYLGTARAGVVTPSLRPLPGGELAEEERGLTVVCENTERCVLATGAPVAWSWNGHRIDPLVLGGAAGEIARVEGVWRGSEGASWALTSETGFQGFGIWRALGDLSRWEKITRVPLALPEGEAVARFVFAAPGRNVWVGLIGREKDGQEKTRGVLELEPGTWRAWHHQGARPAASATASEPERGKATQGKKDGKRVQGEKVAKAEKGKKDSSAASASPSASDTATLPLPDDVRAVWVSEIDGQPATWFCTSLGVIRFLQGSLRVWGESEGFEDESCQGLAEGPDRVLWAATPAGLVRFEAGRWAPWTVPTWPRDQDGEAAGAFAVMSRRAGARGTTLAGTWVATGRGLLAFGGAASAPVVLDASRGFVDERLRALADDGEGRLWALGRAGITLVDPSSVFSTLAGTPTAAK